MGWTAGELAATFASARSTVSRHLRVWMQGHVVELETPRRLALAWHESNGTSAAYGTQTGDSSLVTFDLSADASGVTTLILTHR